MFKLPSWQRAEDGIDPSTLAQAGPHEKRDCAGLERDIRRTVVSDGPEIPDQEFSAELLDLFTTLRSVGIMSNMEAQELIRRRVIISENAFAELVIWQVPKSVPGSRHLFKYRLAFVVRGECVLRYDNEAGKGDHRHRGNLEEPYRFSTLRQLLKDFNDDIERWRNENSDS